MLAPPLETEKSFAQMILAQGGEISHRLDLLRLESFPPNAEKTLRLFSLAEVAAYVGVSPSYIKKLHLEGKSVAPLTSPTGRRSYSAPQMDELRHFLDGDGQIKKYVPHRRFGEKLQICAVVNFKGGSGKTTTAAHLAQYLALTGHRVLAIDLDPQASLTSLHGIQPEIDHFKSLYEALRYDEGKSPIADIIRPTNFPNLSIVPASLDLQEYEYDTPLAIQNKNSTAGKMFYTRLAQAVSEVDDRFDIVIIDCPPQLGYLTLTALAAATSVLITVHPQMLDIMSMSQFLLMLGELLQTIEQAGVKVNLDWFRYLVTRFEPTDLPQMQMVGLMQSMFAQQMLKHPMLKSTAISDAGLTKQSLYEVERGQFIRSTYDRAMESLNAVNAEIAALVHGAWGRA